MNEEELKKLWQSEQTAPTIDFAELQKSLNIWHDQLRRKVIIDIWVQSVTVALCFVPVFFLPKFIFFALIILILGIWYIPELRKLYKHEKVETGSVKKSLSAKISTMQKYFRRTRIAMYVSTPVITLALFYVLYDLNEFLKTNEIWIAFNEFSKITFNEVWLIWLTLTLILCEISVAVVTEIYFKILYKPAFDELKELLIQLESEE